jgi:DNA repair exonuclease SbcCD nuclease subunit
MKKPYALMADLHLHNWSAFSQTEENGINNRLNILLNEIKRAGQMLLDAGGRVLVIAGDVFHVRGSISPSVLNPTLDTFAGLRADGIEVFILPGNHDLEHKSASRLSSAVTALEGAGCVIVNRSLIWQNEDGRFAMLPWHENIADLKKAIKEVTEDIEDGGFRVADYDLIIHAPIDGVIVGLPDHGLAPEDLASYGFKRVFSGHYHNHKQFPGGVFSIGALAHHTWSDVGSAAGFLLVHDNMTLYSASHAPSFIDLRPGVDPDEIPLMVDGHYVRVKTPVTTTTAVNAIRNELNEYGARGVVIQAVKEPELKRSGDVTAKISAGASLNESVADFIKSQSFEHSDEVTKAALKILSETQL